MKHGFITLRTAFAFLSLTTAFAALAAAEQAILTNHLLVQLQGGGEDVAKQIAAAYGFSGARKLPFTHDQYHFYHHGLPKGRRRRSLRHKLHLEKDPRVKTVVQQEGFERKKRGYRNINEIDINMSDPLFAKQWYLINTGQADGTPGLDLNVAEAWELGYTGKGVTIAIMDDGIDYLHPDLASNYNADASYDFSSNDPYPYPRYTDDWFNSSSRSI